MGDNSLPTSGAIRPSSQDVEALLALVPPQDRDEGYALLQKVLADAAPVDAVDQEEETTADLVCDGIREIAVSISEARKQIAALKLPEDSKSKVVEATGELDAIVKATEEATDQILNAGEAIETIAQRMSETGLCTEDDAAAIQNEYMNIVLACSFQDITGQRVQKVIGALGFVEKKVAELLGIVGLHVSEDEMVVKHSDAERRAGDPDGHLLNGPATPGAGIDQDNIDALFD